LNKRFALGELLLALGVLVLSALLAWQTTQIQVSPAYSRIGPRIFPIAICIALAVVGLLLALQALSKRREATSGHHVPADRAAIGLLLAGLVAQTLLLRPLGFVLSSTVMFVLTAIGFGSRRFIRDIAVGLVLAAAIFIGFTRGLSIELPAGLLAGVL
jgi:hypothetical protein